MVQVLATGGFKPDDACVPNNPTAPPSPLHTNTCSQGAFKPWIWMLPFKSVQDLNLQPQIFPLYRLLTDWATWTDSFMSVSWSFSHSTSQWTFPSLKAVNRNWTDKLWVSEKMSYLLSYWMLTGDRRFLQVFSLCSWCWSEAWTLGFETQCATRQLFLSWSHNL